MANVSGNAYGLTILSPIKSGWIGSYAESTDAATAMPVNSHADFIRSRLNEWGFDEESPMAKVPNTYLCRMFVLDDVISQSLAGGDFYYTGNSILSMLSNTARLRALAREDHLQSKYLVYSVNFHGDLDTYLSDLWQYAGSEVKLIWEHCWGFDQVSDASSFITYVKKCQIKTTLFFVGSTDDTLAEQLKGLYLKQELTRFAAGHQGMPAVQLQQAYQAFIKRVEPGNVAKPSWKPGISY